VVLNTGAPAAFTVTVITSGSAIVAPRIASRRLPPTPGLSGAFAVALGTLLIILVLRLYSDWSGLIPTIGPHTSRWKIVVAMMALSIFVPLLFAADGCGVITPTATNASGKALQMPLIQLTLVVN
jgi:hypothetical protein